MRSKKTLFIVAIVVLAVLAVGGTVGAMTLTRSGLTGNGMMNGQQGYQGSQYNQSGMMGGYQQTSSAQGMPVTGVTHMTMQNFAYQMMNIQVRVGTMVTWTNQDSTPHSVTFLNGMKDSGLLSQGQSFSYTFTTPGTYHYSCTAHPYITATVTVVP